MRILMLNYEYPPLGGGGGVASANLSQELVHQGHEVDFITTHFGNLPHYECINGVNIYREKVIGRKGLQAASLISMFHYPYAAIKRATKIAAINKYDVIHSHFAIPSGPAGYYLSKKFNLPHILSVWGGDIYDPSKKLSPHKNLLLKKVVKTILNQANVVVAESNDLRDRAINIYNPKTEVEVIPIGFKKPEFEVLDRKSLGLKDDITYAIAVSRLVARKGYADLLKAVSLCENKEIELLIVGDGPEMKNLRKLAIDFGIAHRVHFLGHISDTKKFQYLNVADFFVLASLHEGFGIVFQEAMSCGLPVITTNNGGQTDFIKSGENGFLVEPGNPSLLAETIFSLLNNFELFNIISNTNIDSISKFSQENINNKYVTLYKMLVNDA